MQVAVQYSVAPWDATRFHRVECCAYPGTGKIIITGHEAPDLHFLAKSADGSALAKPEEGPARHAAGSVLVWLQHAQKEQWFKDLPRGCRTLDLSRMVLMNKRAGSEAMEEAEQKADLHINFPKDNGHMTGVVGTAVALALVQTVRGVSFSSLVGGFGEVTPYGVMLPCRWKDGPVVLEPLRAMLYAGYEGTESFSKIEVKGGTLGKGVCNMQEATEYVFQNVPFRGSTADRQPGETNQE